jgi:hypothetical protein
MAVAIRKDALQAVNNHAVACKHLQGQDTLCGVLFSVGQNILVVFVVIVSRRLAMSEHSILLKIFACLLC